LQYASGTWAYTDNSVLMPYTGIISDGPKETEYLVSVPMLFGKSAYGFATALPADLPMDGVWLPIPSDAWERIPDLSSSYAYLSDCWTLGATGEPTVHIPVAQLTATSSHVVTVSGNLYATTSSSLVQAQPSSTTPVPALPETTSAVTTRTSDLNEPTTSGTSDARTNEATQPAQTPTSTITNEPDPITPSQTSVPVVPESHTQVAESASPTNSDVPAPSSKAVGASVASDGSETATTKNGQTLALTTGLGKPTLVAGGTGPTSTTPEASSQAQAVSISKQTFTPSIGMSSAVVIAGQTIHPGQTTVVSGATVGLQSDNLIVASGTSTATVSLVATPTRPTVQVVTLGSEAFTLQTAAANAVVVAGQTVHPSEAIVISGVTVGLQSGHLVVASGSSTATAYLVATSAQSVAQVATLGTQAFTVKSAASNAVVVGGQTVRPDEGTVLEGATVSLHSGTLILALGTSTAAIDLASTVPTAVQTVTFGSQTFTAVAGSSSAIVVNGHALDSGTATILDGATLSISSGHLVISSGSSSTVLDLMATGIASEPQILTIGTHVYTAEDTSASPVVVDGYTVRPGTTTVIDGATMALSSGNIIVASGVSTATVALSALTGGSQLVTIGTQVITVSGGRASGIVLGGHTVVPGAAAVIDGETMSISGTRLIVASGTETSTLGLGGAIMSGVGGQASKTAVQPYTGVASRGQIDLLVYLGMAVAIIASFRV
jgi:hypothetical protein